MKRILQRLTRLTFIAVAPLALAGTLSCGNEATQREIPSASCGDGVVQTNEQCDDGNLQSGDSCSETCQQETPAPTPACGDHHLDNGEACDDGNLEDNDGCSSICQIETQSLCGDGKKDPGEDCDQIDLGGASCQGLDPYWQGQLACKTDCSYDTSSCTWVKHLGGNDDDYLFSLAIEANGALYAVGSFRKEASFGGEKFSSAGGSDAYLAKFGEDGTPQWSRRLGGSNEDAAFNVKLGPDGSVYLVGYFQGTANFGGDDLISAGKTNAFAAKYDAEGNHQWSRRFGGIEDTYGADLAIAGDGTLYLTGYFSGTANFGGNDLVSSGGMDIFLAKYDAEGGHQWSQRFGGTAQDRSRGLALAPDGQVYMTGHFGGTASFGGENFASAGGADAFVAKYDAEGNHQWSRRFGGSDDDFSEAILTDAQGAIYLTGSFRAGMTIDGDSFANAGNTDGFVVKYNPAGSYTWGESFGGTGYDQGEGLALAPGGSLNVAGGFQDTVTLGGDNWASAGQTDALALKYDPSNGAYLSSRPFGGPFSDMGWTIAVNPQGSVYLGGYFQGGVSFGEVDLTGLGGFDVFLVELLP